MPSEKLWKLAKRQLARDIKKATERGRETLLSAPRARGVSYDGSQRMLIIKMLDRSTLSRPVDSIQGLADASDDQISKVEIMPTGLALRWEELDLDFSVAGLVAGVLGTKAWMAELGRKGGSVQSDAKAIAARINGQKGGRPRSNIIRVRFDAQPLPLFGSKYRGLVNEPANRIQTNDFARTAETLLGATLLGTRITNSVSLRVLSPPGLRDARITNVKSLPFQLTGMKHAELAVAA